MINWIRRLFMDNRGYKQSLANSYLLRVKEIENQGISTKEHGVVARNSEVFRKIEDDTVFLMMVNIVEKALQGEILSVVEGDYASIYNFENIEVVVTNSGVYGVIYKGVGQELGKEGKELLGEAIHRWRKKRWEDKLNNVFGEKE